MFEITKDRNLLSIRLYELQKAPYILDINTGVFLGQQGKPIKTTPKYWVESVRQIMRTLAENHPLRNIIYALYSVVDYGHNVTTTFRDYPNWSKMLKLCDRFQSINYFMDYNEVNNLLQNTDIYDANFKAFAKYRKDHPDISYTQWLDSFELLSWCGEHNLTIDDHFTEGMAKFIRNFNIPDSRIKWYVYYLSRGLYDFMNLADMTRYTIHSWISTYLDCVEKLGQQPQKGDFLRLYTDTIRTYNLRKAEFDNRAIAEHQNSKLHALQFEDDDFIVKVPMTSDEFIAEGEAQNNCVGRLYLPKVIKHTCHIVFVRQKSNPNKSFITCEIYNDGHIGQYLLRNNNCVDRDNPAYNFKLKYQEFLNNNWNRA